MEKFKFEFQVKASEDPKTNTLCITSITDASQHSFLLPERLQPVKLHDEVMKTQVFQKVKNTLQKRHDKRQVWIPITMEMKNVYMDEDGNMQFKGYLLEEVTPETCEQTPAAGISEEALTRILENFSQIQKDTTKPQSMKNLKEKFVIDKFTRKTSNVSQWMFIFETECTRLGIEEDTRKIEALRLFLEDTCLDWYSSMLIKHTIDSKWKIWKENFCETYADKDAKCEFMNPGGSIKDRIAYTMVLEAEKQGLAKPGTRFIEPTSGNTGIGVAMVTAVSGYDCTIVSPDKNSDEKMSTLQLLGADVIRTPTMAPYGDANNFVSVANKMVDENPNALSCDQYTNDVNPLTHYEYTAEEVLTSLGDLDMIVMGAGTGGTVSGVARKIKERCPKCIIVAVDPKGSIMFEEGELKPFFVEGIGGDFVPRVLDKTLIDKVVAPSDLESFNMSREIIRKEGLLCGGSSGAALFSAIKAIQELGFGAGKRVVVLLPDGIRNYMTKFVCDQWMEAHLFKHPPERDFTWWNRSISNLEINRKVPLVPEHASIKEAMQAMGAEHSVVFVVEYDNFLKGVISKKSIRSEATNPKQSGEALDLTEQAVRHVMTAYHKVVENRSNPTVGLVSRILDITPFVLVVEEIERPNKTLGYIPKGIVTDEIVLDFIIKHQNCL